jgi:penicillin-binding protein 1A
VQGGSTITQQVVKTVYAGEYRTDPETGQEVYVVPPRTVGQKVREALLAIKVEQSFTKDEILETYLNTVYFGRGAYGAQAAAQTYYQKDASDLTVSESAMLAGLIQSPATYDPVLYGDGAAKGRRNYVLDRMVAEGYLDADRAEEMKDEPVRTNAIPELGVRFPGKLGYFLDYTRRALIEEKGEAKVFGGGLAVTTTLDMDMQRAAEDAVENRLPLEDDPDAALVAIDPRSGAVLAMYGGKNFNRDQVNLATGAGGTGRQAGSAFKPFTLVAALERGYALTGKYWRGPSSIEIPDPVCYTDGEPWDVDNASDSESGTFTLLSATTHSVNTVYAQVVSAIGPQAVVDVAEDMGIRSDLQPVCSITLGTQEVSPLDMATAYATLAAHGVRHDATPLQTVGDPNGTRLDLDPSEGVRVLDANVADLTTYALETVVTSGTGTNARLLDRPAAGKTGTNQEYRDAWFCGYTPQLVTCVWMGYAEGQISMQNIEGYSAVFGGTLPALIWHDFMTEAMAGRRVIPFREPSFEGYSLGPPTPVASPTPSPSPTESPTQSPTESPSPSPTKSPSPSPSESPSPSPSPTPGPTGPTGGGPTGRGRGP